jgi:general secretion pathway protein E
MVTEAETDIVLETPAEIELEAAAEQRALPFSFAKRHGILISEMTPDGADAVYRAGASPLSIAEVRRYMGVPLKLSRVSPDIFDSMLQASYEQGGQKAMEMVGGLDDEFDLTQVAQELEPS